MEIWNGRFIVWNGYGMEDFYYGMEENCQYGTWKKSSSIRFHALAVITLSKIDSLLKETISPKVSV